MPPHFENTWSAKFANFWLILAIHVDAIYADPVRYFTAVKWWLLRKKVRARGQFTELLGKSPRAYTYSLVRNSESLQQHSSPDQEPLIVGLVSAQDRGTESIELTIRSLALEGVQALVVGEDAAQELTEIIRRIDWQKETWLLPIPAGDRLARGAAATYRQALGMTHADVLYADDDIWDRWGRRTSPHFKPDWNSELFRYHDYITGTCIVRADADHLRIAAAEHDWSTSLVTLSLQDRGAYHIRQVLHHRAVRPLPPKAVPAMTISDALPLVSVIVPTRNRVELLRTCIEGIEKTSYPEIEIIVVDNDSDDKDTLDYLKCLNVKRSRVLRHPGAFNYSEINNRAAALASGKLLCLLNNDIEVVNPDWLTLMATQALRDDVGAVGAKLLYPNGRIQHAGVVIGVGNAAGHAHRLIRPEEEGYFRRHTLPQFVSAVTGACLVVDRERFQAVGGLDEQNFAVAYNDVDLCLRLNRKGWQSLYEPRATLIHHESVSRGFDRDPIGAMRFAGELAALKQIWQTEVITDGFHHPCLSRSSEQFVIAI